LYAVFADTDVAVAWFSDVIFDIVLEGEAVTWFKFGCHVTKYVCQ